MKTFKLLLDISVLVLFVIGFLGTIYEYFILQIEPSNFRVLLLLVMLIMSNNSERKNAN